MEKEFNITCLDCGHKTGYEPSELYCPKCSSQWREARYDYEKLGAVLLNRLPGREFNLWRYEEVLPIQTPMPDLTLGAGGTPLIRAANLGMMLGNPNIYIKDERQGPTHSFKDRQAALTIAALKEAGITEIVIASTGNVAIAYSALAARSGIKCWAFITSLVPAEKMREVALYGTQVIKVTATYDQAKQVAAEFAKQRGFYLDRGTRSISSVEAMKTLAYESTEQLTLYYNDKLPKIEQKAPWRAPDWYIQAVSGGLGPVGVMKGFRELKEMGMIDKLPSVGIIQAEGCSPMVKAWQQDKSVADPISSPRTHIATLATGDPGRSYTLLYDGVKEAGGIFESVTDEEAFRALHVIAKMEGMSIETASSVAFAGVIKLVRNGVIKPDDVVVINNTGHTMPVEPAILGERWARNVVLPTQKEDTASTTPEEGLLAALSRVTVDRFPRVLIVDDTPDARRLIMRILQSQGNYTLLQAANGLEAIEKARLESPDLIILDLMMPLMDGFSVLDRLKEDAITADIPVIVVTAKELTVQEKERLSGRIQSLMQKGSFMDNELLDEIQSFVK